MHGSKIPATAFAWIWDAGRAIQAWHENRAQRRKFLPQAGSAGCSDGCAMKEGGGQQVTRLALHRAAMLSSDALQLDLWSPDLQLELWSPDHLVVSVPAPPTDCSPEESVRLQWLQGWMLWLAVPGMSLKSSCTQSNTGITPYLEQDWIHGFSTHPDLQQNPACHFHMGSRRATTLPLSWYLQSSPKLEMSTWNSSFQADLPFRAYVSLCAEQISMSGALCLSAVCRALLCNKNCQIASSTSPNNPVSGSVSTLIYFQSKNPWSFSIQIPPYIAGNFWGSTAFENQISSSLLLSQKSHYNFPITIRKVKFEPGKCRAIGTGFTGEKKKSRLRSSLDQSQSYSG